MPGLGQKNIVNLAGLSSVILKKRFLFFGPFRFRQRVYSGFFKPHTYLPLFSISGIVFFS
jgi:hypothetical protein